MAMAFAFVCGLMIGVVCGFLATSYLIGSTVAQMVKNLKEKGLIQSTLDVK